MSAQTEPIDFTMMYVTHDALRRDVGRLAQAAASGTATSPQVLAGWENFKTQLHVHHTVEDNDLWPRLYRAVADRPDELTLLKEMEDEHAVLDPLLAQVDAALASDGGPQLDKQLHQLTTALQAHLRHEEDHALPLVQSVLTQDDWDAFGKAMARTQGIRGAAVYVPWIVDDAPRERRKRFFAMLPAPVGLLNRLLWEPRYRQRRLWAT